MSGSYTTVFGVYRDRNHLEQGIDVLINAGFRPEDLSVLLPERAAHERHKMAADGPADGVSTGVVVGGTLGGLAGIGALAIPGVGPFIAAGPIMGAMEGAGLAGALRGMGVPAESAAHYEGIIHRGGCLLSVHFDNPAWAGRAKDVLKLTGAEHVT